MIRVALWEKHSVFGSFTDTRDKKNQYNFASVNSILTIESVILLTHFLVNRTFGKVVNKEGTRGGKRDQCVPINGLLDGQIA